VAAADGRVARRWALLAALLGPGCLGADPSLGVRVDRYAGSDGVTVVSPRSDLALDLDDRTQVGLNYGVDAVSAASFNYAQSKTHRGDPVRTVGNCKACHGGIDAISGASLNYRDTRQELGVTVVRRLGETELKPAYIRSQEDDYLSQTLSLGLSQGLFSRDSTLDLGLRHSDDVSRPVWEKDLVRGLSTDAATLTLTQVLTRRSQARLSAELSDLRGFLSNPYAFVQVGGLTSQPLPERHPDARRQGLLAVAYKQALGWDSALELDYRYYADTWDVTAQTLALQWGKPWGPFTLEAGWRHYAQTQAWFFRNFYAQAQPYLSRDLKLAAFSDDLLNVGLRGGLGRDWSMDLRYGRYLRHDDLDYRLYYANGPVVSDMVSVGVTYH